jgi:hypothetical protein
MRDIEATRTARFLVRELLRWLRLSETDRRIARDPSMSRHPDGFSAALPERTAAPR